MSGTNGARFAERLRRKRALLEAGDPAHEEIRPVLFISGGAERVVYGAGVCIGLHRLRHSNSFDGAFGVSGGAAAIAYFFTGAERARAGATILFEECLSDRFVKQRFPLPLLDIDYLESILRQGDKRLDTAAVLRHRTQFFVGVTRWENGESVLLDAKVAQPDMIAAIKASLALTPVYQHPVVVNGERYTDGGMSEALPIEKMLALFKPTDLLFVSNYSLKESREAGLSFQEKMQDMVFLRRMPPTLRKAFSERHARTRDSTVFVEYAPVTKALLWADEEVQMFTRDTVKLRASLLKGIRDTLTLFGDTETAPESLLP